MIIVFIPAGCRDGSICNTMQPYKKEINEAGVSSFWHLLAITENVTYCNPVTLKKDQLNIVRDKKELLEKEAIAEEQEKSNKESAEWIERLNKGREKSRRLLQMKKLRLQRNRVSSTRHSARNKFKDK